MSYIKETWAELEPPPEPDWKEVEKAAEAVYEGKEAEFLAKARRSEAMPDCLYCGQELTFARGRGYTHAEGGIYMMVCPKCGWKGAPYPSPVTCPKCGSKEVRDDHCACPKRSE